MSVIIDEVVTDPPPLAPATAPDSKKGSGQARPMDIDRLAYEQERLRHRSQRLWAD